MARIVVAMSGGVDSSVAAALVQEAGFEAVGVTLKLLPRLDTGFGCCGSPKDIADAQRVCERLGIPHYTVDLHELFEKKVVAPFVDSYRNAETPNPCIECNRHVKFHHFMAMAGAWGAERVATGHYARVERRESGWALLRARDLEKDQSYFLHTLGQAELAKTLFPVGELTKPQVRAKARALGLATADKAESFEVCFVPKADYRSFVAGRGAAAAPGEIRDAGGRVVGTHKGLHRYTIGQRSGLGLSLGRPVYVVGMDRQANLLVVGDREQALALSLELRQVSWTSAPASPDAVVEVKVRHRGRPSRARVTVRPDGTGRVHFLEAQWAPAPGQSAVFYDGDAVLGGGIIAAAGKRADPAGVKSA